MAAIVQEAATTRVQQFLSQQADEHLAISGWVITEFSSALALKTRRSEMEPGLAVAAHARLQQLAAGVVTLGVSDRHFGDAAEFCRRHELGLRAGDALHLAVAATAGCTLVTLDERLAKAAPEVGVPVAAI